MRKSSQTGYTASLNRLRAILEILESDQADIDLLEPLIAEAVELIKHCRIRLTSAQEAVAQALSGLSTDENDKPVGPKDPFAEEF